MRFLLLLLLAACSTPADAPIEAPAVDATIWHNATVITLDPEQPRATALRSSGGLITEVWTELPADATGVRVDLGGATVLPGLVDAHLHLRGIGAAARKLDLRGTESADSVAALVAAAVPNTPAGAWIKGRGWDQNRWETQVFPGHATLDAVAPEHPVWLTRVDGHAVWLNAKALELAGIDETTPDPEGGRILRGANSTPTGVLVDNAIDLAHGALPEPTAAEIRTDLERGIALCQAAGLTGVHDMGVSPATLEQLKALDAEGALNLRVHAYLGGRTAFDALGAAALDDEGLLRVIGVKLFADGALGSRGAALLAPYSDEPGTSGLLLTEPAQLAADVKAIHDAGFQVAIHAIGDRGNRAALDAIVAAQGSDDSRRHRVEHAQVLSPDDLPRFAAHGIVASMQPTHATSDMPWAPDRLGDERIGGAYAWQWLARGGAHLAFGSDAPVEEYAPLFGLYAAATRQATDGTPEGGWAPEQRMSVEEAIAGFSAGAAFAGHEEAGVLKAGSPAHLTIVDRDPTAVPSPDLLQLKTLRTVVAGEAVYTAP